MHTAVAISFIEGNSIQMNQWPLTLQSYGRWLYHVTLVLPWVRLWECLVCGLQIEAHQKHLLSEPELTLDKALVTVQSLEMVNAQTLWRNEPTLCHLPKGLSIRGWHHSNRDKGRQQLKTLSKFGSVTNVAAQTIVVTKIILQNMSVEIATRRASLQECVSWRRLPAWIRGHLVLNHRHTS